MSVAPGQILSHFRLEQEIGAGGMGVVYRARDLHLERDVAIKVLPAGTLTNPAARERFRKEALALSRLNHHAIATVYDFDTQDGIDFLVMEYVEGAGLDEKLADGALDEAEIVALGQQLVEGLAAAHAEGIVHRDLKPANLRITPEGRLKILDFGLAKLLRSEGEEVATETMTQTQGIVGTFPYMAPEQLQGGKVDARTDVYATGTVLYEMATGRRPFLEKNTARLLYAIAHDAPSAPSSHRGEISTGLESVILKALEKEPAARYQTAGELGDELQRLEAGMAVAAPRPGARLRGRWMFLAGAAALVLAALVALDVGGIRKRLFGGGTPRIASLAVLPLENLSGDPTNEYFVDGMTEALITDLGKLAALRVTPRPSVMRFKGSELSLTEIGSRLGVDALVVGSALPVGDRARVTAQLIDAATERVLWSESYERGLGDILMLQGELARAIAEQVEVTLTPEEEAQLAGAREVRPEAHRAYLEGRHHVSQSSEAGFSKAVAAFERAIEEDPDYAEAYGSLGYALFVLANTFGALPVAEALPRAKSAAEKALELDDTIVEAHVTLGYARQFYDWDFGGAESAFRQAIALDPNHVHARSAYASYLSAMGRHESAIAEARRAVELDPLSLIAGAQLIETLHYARQYDLAIAEAQKLLELDPNFAQAHAVLVRVYTSKGMYAEAVSSWQQWALLAGASLRDVGSLNQAWEADGQEGLWRWLLEWDRKRYGDECAYCEAQYLAALGHTEEAFARLERAFEQKDGNLTFLGVQPWFDSLREDPRLHDLLRRIGLPTGVRP